MSRERMHTGTAVPSALAETSAASRRRRETTTPLMLLELLLRIIRLLVHRSIFGSGVRWIGNGRLVVRLGSNRCSGRILVRIFPSKFILRRRLSSRYRRGCKVTG